MDYNYRNSVILADREFVSLLEYINSLMSNSHNDYVELFGIRNNLVSLHRKFIDRVVTPLSRFKDDTVSNDRG